MRVMLKIRTETRVLETPALANSGYEAETAQLLVPVKVAELLGLWPPEPGSETVFETAGGPLRVWIRPRACYVSVVSNGESSREVVADLVISLLADEILMSDRLISELSIVLEDAANGLWRFRWESPTVLRRSAPPKYWK